MFVEVKNHKNIIHNYFTLRYYTQLSYHYTQIKNRLSILLVHSFAKAMWCDPIVLFIYYLLF